jgi:predicted O-methyltransferase YrrM
MQEKNNSKLEISYTETLGYKKSTVESPLWADSYKVTETIAKKCKVRTMAEIGVARGHHSAHLLEAIPSLKLYVIDPWDLFIDEHYTMWKQEKEAIKKIYYEVVKLLEPFGDRSIILKTTSEKAVKKINEPLDMIFIDADHTYESVKHDIGLWWDKVKDGGIVSGHDYGHSHHPGVKIAVDEFFDDKDIKINTEIGTVWWVEKKDVKEKKRSLIQRFFYQLRLYKKYRSKILIINSKKFAKKHGTRLIAFIKSIIRKVLGEKLIKKLKKINVNKQ